MLSADYPAEYHEQRDINFRADENGKHFARGLTCVDQEFIVTEPELRDLECGLGSARNGAVQRNAVVDYGQYGRDGSRNNDGKDNAQSDLLEGERDEGHEGDERHYIKELFQI